MKSRLYRIEWKQAAEDWLADSLVLFPNDRKVIRQHVDLLDEILCREPENHLFVIGNRQIVCVGDAFDGFSFAFVDFDPSREEIIVLHFRFLKVVSQTE